MKSLVDGVCGSAGVWLWRTCANFSSDSLVCVCFFSSQSNDAGVLVGETG